MSPILSGGSRVIKGLFPELVEYVNQAFEREYLESVNRRDRPRGSGTSIAV